VLGADFDKLFGCRGDGSWEGNFANEDAFAARPLKPLIMREVSAPATSVTVLGAPLELPVAIGPMGYGRRFHADGEAGLIGAAEDAGSLFCASMVASEPIERLTRLTRRPVWVQFWMLKDREAMARLIARAEEAGVAAIVLAAIHHALYRPTPAFEPPATAPPGRGIEIPNLAGIGLDPIPTPAELHGALDMNLTWPDLEWLRSRTSLPLLLKGVQAGTDARRAVDLGVAGVIVSNHGGPGLPVPRPTLDCLLEVSAAIDGAGVEILLDGGVRGGADVLKALAAGAGAVFSARATSWGLVAGGREGAADVLSILARELQTAMAYSGVERADAIPANLI
jgi:4-hydroxymandelate oxidase